MASSGKTEWQIKYEQMKGDRLEKEKSNYNSNIASSNKKPIVNPRPKKHSSPANEPVTKNEPVTINEPVTKTLVADYDSDENETSEKEAKSSRLVIDRPGMNRPSQQINPKENTFNEFSLFI